MCDQSVTLHLAEPDTSSTFAALIGWRDVRLVSVMCQGYVSGGTDLDGLACHWINGACSSDLELVQHHVPQTLIVDDTEIDVGCELLACDARVHWLVAVVVVTGS